MFIYVHVPDGKEVLHHNGYNMLRYASICINMPIYTTFILTSNPGRHMKTPSHHLKEAAGSNCSLQVPPAPKTSICAGHLLALPGWDSPALC